MGPKSFRRRLLQVGLGQSFAQRELTRGIVVGVVEQREIIARHECRGWVAGHDGAWCASDPLLGVSIGALGASRATTARGARRTSAEKSMRGLFRRQGEQLRDELRRLRGKEHAGIIPTVAGQRDQHGQSRKI